jgi:hypothetical protein
VVNRRLFHEVAVHRLTGGRIFAQAIQSAGTGTTVFAGDGAKIRGPRTRIKAEIVLEKLASADRLVPGARVYFGLDVPVLEVCDSRGKTTGGK